MRRLTSAQGPSRASCTRPPRRPSQPITRPGDCAYHDNPPSLAPGPSPCSSPHAHPAFPSLPRPRLGTSARPMLESVHSEGAYAIIVSDAVEIVLFGESWLSCSPSYGYGSRTLGLSVPPSHYASRVATHTDRRILDLLHVRPHHPHRVQEAAPGRRRHGRCDVRALRRVHGGESPSSVLCCVPDLERLSSLALQRSHDGQTYRLHGTYYSGTSSLRGRSHLPLCAVRLAHPERPRHERLAARHRRPLQDLRPPLPAHHGVFVFSFSAVPWHSPEAPSGTLRGLRVFV